MSASAVMRSRIHPSAVTIGKRHDCTEPLLVPFRKLMRLALRILVVKTEEPDAPRTDIWRGENAERLIAEDLFETYLHEEFMHKVGTSLALAEKFVAKKMAEGLSEEQAIRHLLKVLHTEESQ